jgi:hypothetical protein
MIYVSSNSRQVSSLTYDPAGSSTQINTHLFGIKTKKNKNPASQVPWMACNWEWHVVSLFPADANKTVQPCLQDFGETPKSGSWLNPEVSTQL